MQGVTHVLAAGIICGVIRLYWISSPWLLLLSAAFALGILSHAILDPIGRTTFHPPDIPRDKEPGARFWLPYHIFMYSGAVAASIWLFIVFRSQLWLLLPALIGAMLPDFVDLGYRSLVKLRGKIPKQKTWSTSTEMTLHKYICWPMEQITDRVLPDLAHDSRGAAVELAIDIALVTPLIFWFCISPLGPSP